MNRIALAAIGFGAVYFMKNKEARDKLMQQVQSFTGMSMGMNQQAGAGPSS